MMASEIAGFLNSKLVGRDIEVIGVCSLNSIRNNHTAFCKHNILHHAYGEALFIVGEDTIVGDAIHIRTENPRLAHAKVVTKFFNKQDDTVYLKDGSSFRGDLKCQQVGGVIIYDCVEFGKNCYFKPGAVIGTPGFAFERNEDKVPLYRPHTGGVKIGDNVRIGANAIVQRGTYDSTVIGDNVKIDDLVHVAHNCNIGGNSIIVSGTVICGTATIGKNCWIGANSVIMQHITIGDNVTIGIGANVVKSVPDGATYAGFMARPLEELK